MENHNTTVQRPDHSVQLNTMLDEASKRCGQSYETMMLFFRHSVEAALCRLPKADQADFLAQARKLGYQTQQEADQDRGPDECIHGFDEKTCPLGCFERDYFDG